MSDSVWPHRWQPTRSPISGILQAKTLKWVAISFSNAWKWKVKMKSLGCVQFLATPWAAAYQAPLSMGFSRQEYWSGVPLPSPLNLVTLNSLNILIIAALKLSVKFNTWAAQERVSMNRIPFLCLGLFFLFLDMPDHFFVWKNGCPFFWDKTTHIYFLIVSVGQEFGHRICKAAVKVVAWTGFSVGSSTWNEFASRFQ